MELPEEVSAAPEAEAAPADGSWRRLRRGLVAARDRLDRVLHPYRRRRAAARLAGLAPDCVLFVCLGNVCRSPFAAYLLEARTGGAIRSGSAGFIGPGRAPPPEALQVAASRGIRHEGHVSRVLASADLDPACALFVFDRFNARDVRARAGAESRRVFWLGDFDPEWSGKRAILDPWGKPVADFEITFDRIARCVDEVARILTRRVS